MIQAYILMEVQPGFSEKVVLALKRLLYTKKAVAVTGPYDVVADVEAKNIEELYSFVLKEVQKIEGINKTTTLLAME